MVEVYKDLGVPLVMNKVDGPKPCLTFLGIKIDTDWLQIWLPVKKLKKVNEEVQYWLSRWKACKKRELQSLCGLLQQACKVVHPEQIFLQCFIGTTKSASATKLIVQVRYTCTVVGCFHIRLEQGGCALGKIYS